MSFNAADLVRRVCAAIERVNTTTHTSLAHVVDIKSVQHYALSLPVYDFSFRVSPQR